MPDFHGVLPALITPFTEDGTDVDADALAAIVDRLVDAGVGGLVPGGSTGEFTTLTNAERREVIEVTVEAAAGRVPVVAGTGALSTRETVELSLHAERAGAAAVMVVPPFYEALGWRELLAHYTAVADAISIPIMYYNLPSASGVTLTAEQLRELPITSLKDTGGDASAATELIQTDGPTLLNGWDTLTFAALAAGVRAVVWGTASILPEQCVALHRLLIDDIDLPAARELWTRLWPLCHFLESQSYSAAVKTACALVGDTTGPVRAPLLPLDDDARGEFIRLLEPAEPSLASASASASATYLKPALVAIGVGVVDRVAAAQGLVAAVLATRAGRQALSRADLELVAAVGALVGAGRDSLPAGTGLAMVAPFEWTPQPYPAAVSLSPKRGRISFAQVVKNAS